MIQPSSVKKSALIISALSSHLNLQIRDSVDLYHVNIIDRLKIMIIPGAITEQVLENKTVIYYFLQKFFSIMKIDVK